MTVVATRRMALGVGGGGGGAVRRALASMSGGGGRGLSSCSRSTKSAASVSLGTGRNVAAASLVGQARVTLGSRIGGLLRSQVRTLASSTACLVPRKRKIEAVPVSELEKELEANPFAERYKEKIQQELKTRAVVKEGVEVFEKDLSFQSMQEEKDRTAAAKAATTSSEDEDEAADGPLDFVDKGDLPSYAPPLSTILHVHKLRDVAPEDIAHVWSQHVSSSENHLAAVIPGDVYDTLYSRGQDTPVFVYPLPQGDGIDFYLGQFSGNVFAFTSLLEYQAHGENARPILTLFHYTELKRSKDVVLMLGELDTERMNAAAAQLLVHQVQLFYTGEPVAMAAGDDGNTKRSTGNDAGAGAAGDSSNIDPYALVKQFNSSPEEFDHMAVVECFASWFGDTLGAIGVDSIKHDPSPQKQE